MVEEARGKKKQGSVFRDQETEKNDYLCVNNTYWQSTTKSDK